MSHDKPIDFTQSVKDIVCEWLDLSEGELAEGLRLAAEGGYNKRGRAEAGRELHIPVGCLYTIQSRIQQRLLRTISISSAAHGGMPGMSVLTHVSCHLPGAYSILAMDLTNAYGSVSQSLVNRTLRATLKHPCREQGIQGKLCREIAQLLTRLTTVDNHLPVGAPTSSTLLNLAASPLDKTIERLVLEHVGKEGRYSRYLDDMVISSSGSIPADLEVKVAHAVRVHDLGTLNRKKTRYLSRSKGDTLSIMGIIHDGEGFALEADRLDALVKRLEEPLSRKKASPMSSIIWQQLMGTIRFARTIYGNNRLPAAIRHVEDVLGKRIPTTAHGGEQ
jgi:hypothetical protein